MGALVWGTNAYGLIDARGAFVVGRSPPGLASEDVESFRGRKRAY